MEMTRQIRPLYVRVHFNAKPMSKVMVDNGLIVNVMPLRMLRALGRGIGDLIEIEVSVSAFIGEISKTMGILPVDIIMGSKTSLSAFFVINSTTNYNALLGIYYIHANWCVSSFLLQFLLFWKGGDVELLWENKQPFIATFDSIEANYYDREFSPIKFKGKKKDKAPMEIYTELRDTGKIQRQGCQTSKDNFYRAFQADKGTDHQRVQ